MSTLDHILASLEGVRETPNGWSACCPAHDDNDPSLSVAEGQNGKVWRNCHVGCTVEQICEKLGITPADLFSPSGTAACTDSPTVRKSVRTGGRPMGTSAGRLFSMREEAVSAAIRIAKGRPTGDWTYQNCDRRDVFAVVRIETSKGKTFRPVYQSEGGWRIDDPTGPLPLYCLPHLTDAPRWRIWPPRGRRSEVANSARDHRTGTV